MKRVVLTITRTGTVDLEASGFTGYECITATEEIENHLGGESRRSLTAGVDFSVNVEAASRVGSQEIRLEF